MTSAAIETDRTSEILDAIRSLIKEHDDWENDLTSPNVPTEAIDQAAVNLDAILHEGGIPADCTEVFALALDFTIAWGQYQDGDFSREKGKEGCPKPYVWSAFRELRRSLEKHSQPPRPPLESVTELKRQGCTHHNIAIAYATRNEKTGEYIGPFIDKQGRPLADLIEQQFRAEQGNGERVVPEGYCLPAPVQVNLEQVSKKLRNLNQRREQTVPPKDKGTPESLALEGAFPHQIMGAFNMTAAEVEALFQRLGLTPASPDLPSTMPEPPPQTAGPDPFDLKEELKQKKQKREAKKTKQEIKKEADAILNEPESDAAALESEIEILAVGLHAADDSLGAPDIARKISEQLGVKVDGRKVAGILKRAKQPA